MKKVFFYGLFMDPDFLEEKGHNPKNVQLVYSNGYQLIIGEKASLLPKAGAKAYGTIMDLQTDELNLLYAAEGVQDYVPQALHVHTMSGKRLEVLCYILPKDKMAGSNSEYARQLAKVAEQLGLPESYIEEIKTWV